ncbi:hypothetical protein SAMN05444392_102327 [Seinonella peptonophila]|uniref:HNH nuclease domain-containing protein n=1 Tax=Seinonella peptonophila TaxID=112248 RepID=A0A1M4VEQ8_9BACL|nr:HNH endonuclease [Seinonella peptonophila]SHE67484.1 hypothetical protein SAMN05444392_102327 [Seinonella peptonophila]
MPFNDYEVRGETTAFFIVRRNGDVHEVLIDTEDLPSLIELGRRWCYNPVGGGYAQNTYYSGTINGKEKYKTIQLHRFILDFPFGKVVDHINRCTLDNRKTNLRACAQKENLQNYRGAFKNNKSGIRGVTLDKEKGKWRALVQVDCKMHHLGYFLDKQEAEKVVTKFRREHMPYSQMDQGEQAI